MVSGPSPELIATLRNPQPLDQQITTLKQVKNDIVGHDQRKELVVKQGIVEALVGILASASKATGKRKSSNGEPSRNGSSQQEHEVRLQATLILGSLASGGRAFVQPLLAADTVRYLLDALASESTSPPRLVTGSLQALRSLAQSAYACGDAREQISLNIFSQDVVPIFRDLLRQPSNTSTGKQQVKLTAEIIALTATQEDTRSELARYGILDTLAALLASHSISGKLFHYHSSTAIFPPAPPSTIVPTIISAITAIITDSAYRVQSFVLSPPVRDLLFNSIPAEHGNLRNGVYSNPVEPMLPQLHIPAYRSISFNNSNGGSSAFPALSSLQPASARVPGITFDASQHGGDIEHANAVVGWLLVLARSFSLGHQGSAAGRLHALRLLALVNNAIDADSALAAPRSEVLQLGRQRERLVAMLAVPLAVKFVQNATEGSSQNGSGNGMEKEVLEVREEACEVLALLIQGNKELQVAAVEAGATKKVCSLLKKSFDNVQAAKPMWPSSKSRGTEQSVDMPQSCKMGSRGLPPELQHVMRVRYGALEALAALASREDLHRKAIVEAGAVSCVIDSLKPFPPRHGTNTKTTPKDTGNTTPVVLAACHAAQSLSRSVSLLRTSLIDGGIAQLIFALLKHADRGVQIAATDVCCNLLLDFSPMRDDLLAAGVIRTLTEHARGEGPGREMDLRLASLWALKHLVHAAPREVKVSCLEELGTGWLVGAIQGDQKVVGSVEGGGGGGGVSVVGVGQGLSTPNAAGEQVDLLNPTSAGSMDLDVEDPGADDSGNGGDEEAEDEDEDGEMMYDEASSTHYQASQLRSTLQNPTLGGRGATSSGSSGVFNSQRYLDSVRENEQSPQLRAKRDDLAVQEQALDFVRNLLNGEDCATMLECLFEQVGVEELFALLTEKLASVPSSSAAGVRGSSGTASSSRGAAAGPGSVYQPTALILSTIHVLTHISNGSPKHKNLLLSHKNLLSTWLPHFNHPDRRVRVISVWCVNSLTWIEDEHDRADAQRRARELKMCGIEAAVRGLVGDGDLDVRERVRTAVRQFEGL